MQVTDDERVGGSLLAGASGTAKNAHNALLISAPLSTRFFPTYGTDAFFEKCSWIMEKRKENKGFECTFLVRPLPDTTEGISHWIPQIVAGHLFALQTGCNLYFDYGPGVDIQQVLIPFPAVADGYRPIKWTVPPGFVCGNETQSSACFLPRPSYAGIKQLEYYEDTLNMDLSPVPDYRFAYKYSRDFFLKQNSFLDIQTSLPGLQLESAMACSLASLCQLSPSMTQFQADLFTGILPTLHQKGAFVMALYIRTGHADVMANKEKEGKKAAEATINAKLHAQKVIKCVLELEQEYIANSTLYSRIVWLVASDSPFVKRWVAENYDTDM